MLRLNLGKTKHKEFYTLRNPGFIIPPENQLYECRPPKEVKTAMGVIIKAKGGYVKTRGGPANLGTISGNLTQQPVSIKRNVFLPQRQSFNPIAPRTSRVSDEERKRIKQEDVAKNGTLVQVSDKTLNRVFEKFDLFTISNKILKMKRQGLMSKQDVRASALLKLTKEVMNAIREGRASEAKEAVDKIEEKHAGTIPTIDELGTTPEEVKENPLLPLAMLNNADLVNEETFLLLEDLIAEGKLYINPETLMIGDLIPLHNLLSFDLEELKNGLEDMYDSPVKDLLQFIIGANEEEMISDSESDEPELPQDIPEVPAELPEDILDDEFKDFNPVEPTPEEVKEDVVYQVVRSGKDVGKSVRKYIVELNNKLERALTSLPIQKLDTTEYNKLSENQNKYNRTATELLNMSMEPDNVLDDEKKQEEIEGYLNILNNLVGDTETIARVLNLREPTPPKQEVMTDTEEKKEEPPTIPEQLPRDVLFEEFDIPVLNPKRYFSGEPLSVDEMKNPKLKRVGTREEVWNGLAIRTGTNQRTSLAREDLVFDRNTQKVKSKKAVMGSKSRRKPTRRKKK
jgi:hypothetical protein